MACLAGWLTGHQVAEEQKKLSEGVTSTVVERVQQLQERQTHMEKHLSAEGNALVRQLRVGH